MSDPAQTTGNDLLDRLAQAGLFEEQLRPLRFQQQLAQSMMGAPGAQGRNVGNTYVAASPLEHLSGLAQKLVGAFMQQRAMGKEQDLAKHLGQTRGDYGKALADAAAPVQHPPEMLQAPGYNPAAEDQGQQQRLQQLATSGMLSGDPVMSQVGQRMTDPRLALERQAVEQGAQKFPLELAMEKQKLAAQGPQEALGGQTPSTFEMLTKRQQVPKYAPNPMTGSLFNVHTGEAGPGGGGSPAGLSQEAVDQAAHAFATTGTLPKLPMGKAGALITAQIVNRAAELHPDANLAGAKASYSADTRSLGNLTKQSDAMNAFEGTALKNLDQFLTTAHGVVDTGSPLFNAPARAFMQKVAGDPKMAQFAAARNVAVQEISKVLGGSLGGSAVSDSARHEASGLISPDMSLAQIEAVANILKQDMANRRASLSEQINSVRGRASGAPAASAPPSGNGAPAERTFKRVDGKLVEVK